MAKRVLFIVLLAGLSINSPAQNSKNITKQALPITAAVDASTNQRILEALDTICKLQQEEHKYRMDAFKSRDILDKNHSSNANPSDYSVISDVEHNTRFNFWQNGWNIMALIALLVSVLSMYYNKITYKAQKNTEQHTKDSENHTKNAPISVQKSKLKDLARHFYRNLVCTSAAIFKYKDESNRNNTFGKPEKYPSESNILKLQVLPDDIVMPIDVADKSYEKMHELRLLFRNYNIEVETASMHLSRRGISDESLLQDFDNLLYKPLTLVRNTYEYEQAIYEESKEKLSNQVSNNIESIILEHFKKLKNSGNFGVLLISDHSKFLRSLLDNDCGLIHSEIDIKGGITRSLNNLFEEGHKQSQLYYDALVEYNEETTEQNQTYLALVDKNCFINRIEDESLKTFVSRLSGIVNQNKEHSFQEFKNFYKVFYEGKIREPIDNLSIMNMLLPYLEFLSSDKWDFEKLLYYMLAVDIAIETDRIGMVNYVE